MRRFTMQWLGVLAFLLACSIPMLTAQEQQPTQVIVTQTVTNDDGSTVVTKKRLTDPVEVKAYLESIEQLNAQDVEVRVLSDDTGALKEDISRMKKELHVMRHEMRQKIEKEHNYNYNYNFNFDHDDRNYRSDRPLLGIYPEENENGQGLLIDEIVHGGGAKAAGLQAGDVITAIDGNSINSLSDLRTVISNYDAGDAVLVDYVRNGQKGQVQSVLSERQTSWNRERDPCRVFIGVLLSGNGANGKGVNVTGIIGGWPAEAAGMLRGDVITAIDGVEVNSYGEIRRERDKHEPGEFFTVSFLRNGAPQTVQAQFRECPKEEVLEAVEEPEEEVVVIEEIPEEPAEEVVVVEEPEIELEPETVLPQNLIDNQLELLDFSAYPNPTFGRVQVEFRAAQAPTTIIINDINGKVVYRETLNRFDGYYNKEFNFTNVTPGTLYLSIRQGDKIVSEKIVLLTRA